MAREPTIDELQDRIEDLETQVSYWRGQVEETAAANVRAALQTGLGLTPAEAWILATLHQRGGKVITRERFQAAELPGTDDRVNGRLINTVNVFISKLRRKIGDRAIESVWGVGYRITPHGSALCEAALQKDQSCSAH